MEACWQGAHEVLDVGCAACWGMLAVSGEQVWCMRHLLLAQRAVALRWEDRQAGVPVLFAAYQASRRPACIWALCPAQQEARA